MDNLKFSKEKVRPSNFEVKGHFFESPFKNWEKETVARNIILIPQWNNNEWLEFTWEDYQEKCEHNVTIAEKHIIDEFTKMGLLLLKDGIYSITDFFIEVLKQFIKK